MAWYDAADPSTISFTGNLVDQWRDKSGNDFDFVSSGSARPATGTDTIGGLNALRFDGVDNLLALFSFPMTPNTTIYAVYRPIATSGNSSSVISFANTSDIQLDAQTAGQFLCRLNAVGLGISNITSSQGNQLGLDTITGLNLNFLSSLVTMRVNGAPAGSASGYTTGLTASETFRLGVNRGAGENLDMRLGEVVIYTRSLSSQEEGQLEQYFSDKWGIFIPTQLNSLVMWLDAAEGVTLNGPDVSNWADQSGNGNDAVQAVASNQPLFNATGLNGFPSLGLDGATEFMDVLDSPSIDITSSFTAYFVINAAVFSNFPNLIARNFNTGYRLLLGPSTGQLSTVVANGAFQLDTSPSAISLSTDTILEFHYEINGTINFTANGVSLGTQTNTLSGVNSNNAVLNIGVANGGTNFYEGEMAQILLFNTLLSTANRNNVGNYLANRYGLTWTTIP